MRKFLCLLISLILVGLIAGCGSTTEEQPEEQVDYEIAMVTDSGMIMDGGYSQVAWDAISEFGADKGISHKYYKASEATESAYKEVIDNAVEKGAKVIVADGYTFENVLYDAQKEHEKTKFILIDAEPTNSKTGKTSIGDNTVSILFASEEAGYLAGYGVVKDGDYSLGFIGEAKEEMFTDYGYGFLQGADRAAQDLGISVNVEYWCCDEDSSNDEILNTASKWYDNGTEVIFACGREVEQPVIEAAEMSDKAVITSETDKSEMSDTVITSAEKEIEDALTSVLKQYNSGDFPGGEAIVYNAENDGVSLEMKNGRFSSFSKSDYRNILAGLSDGSIEVSTHDIGSISSLTLSNVSVSKK